MISILHLVWLIFYIVAPFINDDVEAASFAIQKKSAAPERLSDDYPDYYLGVKYDEYPVSKFKFCHENLYCLGSRSNKLF